MPRAVLTTVALLGVLCSLCAGSGDAYAQESLWSARPGAVILERDRPNSLVLMQATADPTRNLNADDFNFGFHGGLDMSILRHFDGDRAAEVRYVGVDGWSSATTAITNTTLLMPLIINTQVPVTAPNVQRINATYGSDLESIEANWRRPLGDSWTLLAGFRYVELDEQLRANLVTPVPTFTYDITTQNRMYGFQAGAEAFLYQRGCFSLEGNFKAGIYHNSGAHTSVLNTTRVSVVAGQRSNRPAFLGELGLTGVFDLTDRLSLRGGYNLMWIESVALASDQIPATNFTTFTGIDSSGGVFYHGAIVSLEWLH